MIEGDIEKGTLLEVLATGEAVEFVRFGCSTGGPCNKKLPTTVIRPGKAWAMTECYDREELWNPTTTK